MVSFNYISKLRTTCIPVEVCGQCACFPLCLEDTTLELLIDGMGPDITLVGDCIFPFTSCHFAVTYTFSFGSLDGPYILEYIGAGAYRITFADSADAADVRASGIRIRRQATNFANAPCTTCAGQNNAEEEDYITAITVQLTCDDNQMWMTPAFSCRQVSRSRTCSAGVPSAYSAWGFTGTSCSFAPNFCTGTSHTTAEACRKESPMTTTLKRGTMAVSGCNVGSVCTDPTDITFVGEVVDV